VTAVIEAIRQRSPSFMGLTLYIGLTGFPLGIERIELLLEPLLGRFTGVDRAPNDLPSRAAHEPSALRTVSGSTNRRFLLSRSSKNAGPDQLVPVMALAMTESER